MARRNPMNERYQKHTSPAGKTRRSAASAKPKRSAGAGEGGSSGKPASSATKKRGRLIINPNTPEFKKWRRIWWIFLGGAIVLSTAAWFMWSRGEQSRELGNWVLGVGYAMIFIAIGIDWVKLRPMRQEWARTGGASTEKKSDESTDES